MFYDKILLPFQSYEWLFACETRCNVKHIMSAEKQRHQMSNFTADLESAPDDVGLDKQSEG